MARVFVTRRFQQSFEARASPVQGRVRAALEKIRTNPRVGKALTGPLSGEFSLRVGAYRVIYSFDPDEDTVWLETVRHRRDVYRRRKSR
ncbi:MAG: type II toxin-antitoxin system RelE/ParE family toxin [Armatimonadetes bacterium]|nr:type II toxin-antitoxin system RelE/ParE family toxin [Armatimonadota bacterium]